MKAKKFAEAVSRIFEVSFMIETMFVRKTKRSVYYGRSCIYDRNHVCSNNCLKSLILVKLFVNKL